MAELKPCPFCGMKPPDDLIDTLYPRDRSRTWWGMHCTENMGGCGAEVTGETREAAIAAWNRRAAPGVQDTTKEPPHADQAQVMRKKPKWADCMDRWLWRTFGERGTAMLSLGTLICGAAVLARCGWAA